MGGFSDFNFLPKGRKHGQSICQYDLAGGLSSSAEVFVQIISFPDSHVWIWIGDKKGDQPNLALAMGSRLNPTKEILSTNVLNATLTDESSYHTKALGERISKKLKGKPVYISCALPESAHDTLQTLEKQIFMAIKKYPERF